MLDKPHWETNEDGLRTWHPGYDERTCELCGEKFLCSVNWEGNICSYCRKKGGKSHAVTN